MKRYLARYCLDCLSAKNAARNDGFAMTVTRNDESSSLRGAHRATKQSSAGLSIVTGFVLITAMAFLLTGCFSPVRNTRGTTYVLSEVPAVETHAKHHAVILVLPPKTSVLYDTTKIIYTTRPYQFSYFSRHEWTAKPGEMLSPLIVETLQRTHHFRAVVTPPYLGEYQYALRTNVLMLRENFTSPTPYAEFALSAQLYRAEGNQLIADQQWIARVPLAKVTPYDGALAANQAVARVLQKLARFCE